MARLTAAQQADLRGAAGVSAADAEAVDIEAADLTDPADLEPADDDDGQADDADDDDDDADAAAVLGTASERTRPMPASWPPKVSAAAAERGPGHSATEADEYDVPKTVRPYLKADESKVIALRRHGIRLVLPALGVVGGLAAAIALNGWAYSSGHARPIVVHLIWWSWLILAGFSVYKWLEWRQTWFVVTGHRLMLIETTRLLGRRVRMLPFDKLRDLEFSQTPLGRVAGYARFTFASIGTGGAENALQAVDYLPWPEWLYGEINELTMPTPQRKVMRRGGRV